MENFFVENGRKYLLFFYSDHESGDKGPSAASASGAKNLRKNKVQIMESSDVNLKGICIFFVRNPTIQITNSNVSNVIYNFIMIHKNTNFLH